MKRPRRMFPRRDRDDLAERIRRAVGLLATMYRKVGEPDWRGKILQAAKDALSPDPRKWRVRSAGSMGLTGIPPEEAMISSPGVFRMILRNEGVDIDDDHTRERFISTVQDALSKVDAA